jgi:hypothetical protein
LIGVAGVLIEGFAAEELLSWPADKLRELVAVGRPIVFRAGSSTVLAAVQIEERRLIIELAHIDGGGEGVLPTLWRFGQSYARAEQFVEIEWLVHATRCARPNPRLPTVLEKMGFIVEDLPVRGLVYRRVDEMLPSASSA